MIKGYLKITVLKLLLKKEMSGYDIMNQVSIVLDKRPSSGSIYPLMTELNQQGFVALRIDGRRKLYSITPKGKKILTNLIKEKEKVMVFNMNLLNTLETITGKKEMKQLKQFFKTITSKKNDNRFFFTKTSKKILQLKNLILNLTVSDNFKKKEPKLDKILDSAINQIKKLSK